jgi:hypothetical protein
MAKTKAQKHAEIHNDAVKEFDDIHNTTKDERAQCLEDRRFYSIAGAQWESRFTEQFENKPKMEVNKVHLSVMRIINEYRNNRITVDFVSKDGTDNDKLSNTCDGLYRADEQDSVADEAYDNAFEEAIGGGFGAWRLRAEYEDEYDEDNDYQRIRIEPIYDADSCVYFDLNSKRQDKRDAGHCFVLTSMTKDAYKEEWKDEPDSWDTSLTDDDFDWAPEDMVYVAEYYKVEEVKKTVHIYTDIDGEEKKYDDKDFEDDIELEAMLFSIGTVKTGERKIKCKKVHKYIMSGGKILEDCGYVAGTRIPIIPVYGKRWYVDNIERYMGHVRLAKDAQRLKNMQLSKLAEISALSTVEKPIVSPEQMAGHANMWADDNVTNYPYLLLNPTTDAEGNPVALGPTAYTKVPDIPPAMAALLQITEQDMKDLLGNQEQGEQLNPNMSGKAVELIQGKLDMQQYIYMSNFAKAMKCAGEVWLSMARELMIEDGRQMKTVDPDNRVGFVKLNTPTLNSETQATEYDNDLKQAKFDVTTDVGPSSSSKREATVRKITGLMQFTTDPETMGVLTNMAVMNMEGEGMDEIRSFFRMKLVRQGVIEATEVEQKQLDEEAQNTPPDPNGEYLKAAALNEEAKSMLAKANTTLALAKAEKTGAETKETIADIERDDQKLALDIAKEMKGNT